MKTFVNFIIFFVQVVEGIKPTLLELQKFETAPEDVELEGMCFKVHPSLLFDIKNL